LAPNVASAANSPEDQSIDTVDASPVHTEIFTSQNNSLLNNSEVEINDNQVVVFPSTTVIEPPPPPPEYDPKPKPLKKNLFSHKGTVIQYNNVNCVPASVQMMLNFTYLNGTMPEGFEWKLNTSNKMQSKLGAWIRDHDELYSGGRGSDPDGFRNGLNKFSGVGNFKKQNKMLYEVVPVDNREKAMKIIASSIKEHDKPVGLIGWNGKHAQVVTGYELSENGKVKALLITSSLRSDHMINERVTRKQLKKGEWKKRLTFYTENDSPYDDPYTRGKRAAYKDWKNKIVLIVPTR